jgi:hypothetical protein
MRVIQNRFARAGRRRVPGGLRERPVPPATAITTAGLLNDPNLKEEH